MTYGWFQVTVHQGELHYVTLPLPPRLVSDKDTATISQPAQQESPPVGETAATTPAKENSEDDWEVAGAGAYVSSSTSTSQKLNPQARHLQEATATSTVTWSQEGMEFFRLSWELIDSERPKDSGGHRDSRASHRRATSLNQSSNDQTPARIKKSSA